MILDKQNLISDAQDLAVAAGTVLSTNTIDLGATGTPIIGGAPVADVGRSQAEILVQVTETFTSGGAGTLKAQVITSASANLGTPTVISSSEVIALATLVAGYQFRVTIPPGVTQRYLGVQYVVATATMTAGKCTAAVVLQKQTNPFVG